MKTIYTTTLRLNLADEDDRQAFEHLRRLDKREVRSYSKAIVTAINAYYGRKEHLAKDPYLETREKEDAFLRKILDTIQAGLQTTALSPTHLGTMLGLMQKSSTETPEPENPATSDEDLSAALDFADSF